jgi:hypothetical protein
MRAMATFNVFVEGAVDPSPAGLPQLAAAMAQRYGLQPTDLVARLRRGRFRVKSSVDAPTAEKYRRDLESIGARVLIEDATISPTATPPAGVPAQRPAALSLPPINERNKPSLPPSPLAGQPQRPSQPIPASGLAAAFTDTAQQDLGALSGGALALAALDGSEDVPAPEPPPPPKVPEAAFAPPAPKAKPAEKGAKPAERPKEKPADQALDLFAPPDADDVNFVVDLATEEVEERAAKRVTAPPATKHAAAADRAEPTPVSLPDARPRRFSRPHFVAGVVIALVAGFVPVHFIASMREKSAFAEIDNKVAAAHASVDSYETYTALDAAREKLIEEKQDKQKSIGLTSMLLWAVISAGVGFALLHYGRFAHPPQR